MVKSLKRVLSLALALIMVFGMIPENAIRVFAAEGYDHHPDDETKTATVDGSTAQPTGSKPDGTHWEAPSKSTETICGKIVHSHNDDCYDKVFGTCSHTEHN